MERIEVRVGGSAPPLFGELLSRGKGGEGLEEGLEGLEGLENLENLEGKVVGDNHNLHSHKHTNKKSRNMHKVPTEIPRTFNYMRGL